MFYYLAGDIAVLEPGIAVLDVGGVGYELAVSDQTMRKLQEVGKGKRTRVYTHFLVREDAVELYGFYEDREREMFRMLLTVSGVGPKVALSILNLFAADQLVNAIVTENVKAIAKASGVGSKTAARVVLELKDKLAKTYGAVDGADLPVGGAGAAQSAPAAQADAVNALLALGFSRSEALSALQGMDLRGMSVEDIIRTCLRRMGDHV